jgi:hypothetical protein
VTGQTGSGEKREIGEHVRKIRAAALVGMSGTHHRSVPALRAVPTLPLRSALGGSGHRLWDEARGTLIRFLRR